MCRSYALAWQATGYAALDFWSSLRCSSLHGRPCGLSQRGEAALRPHLNYLPALNVSKLRSEIPCIVLMSRIPFGHINTYIPLDNSSKMMSTTSIHYLLKTLSITYFSFLLYEWKNLWNKVLISMFIERKPANISLYYSYPRMFCYGGLLKIYKHFRCYIPLCPVKPQSEYCFWGFKILIWGLKVSFRERSHKGEVLPY